MNNKTRSSKISETLHIIWTIAYKDIADAFQNKLVLSLVLSVSIMLLMPKLMGLIIEPPYWTVLTHDPGHSKYLSSLDEDEKFNVKEVESFKDFINGVGSMGFGMGVEFGLALPEDLDQSLETGQTVQLDGYVAWPSRIKVLRIKGELDQHLTGIAGTQVSVNFEDHVIYTPPDAAIVLGIVTWVPVIIILMIGTTLIPHLFFEEKQT